jgi:hypothetical protein
MAGIFLNAAEGQNMIESGTTAENMPKVHPDTSDEDVDKIIRQRAK